MLFKYSPFSDLCTKLFRKLTSGPRSNPNRPYLRAIQPWAESYSPSGAKKLTLGFEDDFHRSVMRGDSIHGFGEVG